MSLPDALHADYVTLVRLLPADRQTALLRAPSVLALAEALADVPHFHTGWHADADHSPRLRGRNYTVRIVGAYSHAQPAFGTAFDEALLAALVQRSGEMDSVRTRVAAVERDRAEKAAARDAFLRAFPVPEGIDSRAAASLAWRVGAVTYTCEVDVASGPHATQLRGWVSNREAEGTSKLTATGWVDHVTVGEIRKLAKAGLVTIEPADVKGLGWRSRTGARLTLAKNIADALLAEGLVKPPAAAPSEAPDPDGSAESAP